MEDSSHEQPDQEAPKILPHYSITLSAGRSTECGMARPRAWADFMFTSRRLPSLSGERRGDHTAASPALRPAGASCAIASLAISSGRDLCGALLGGL
jgi:hypothetical protein